ncbi:hypothetical protein KPATCC21470_0309 [Kitasatospora purpeofusca]
MRRRPGVRAGGPAALRTARPVAAVRLAHSATEHEWRSYML